MREFVEYHPDVKRALQEARPIVALESTLIAHGLPYPQNLELALDLQKIAQNMGVTAATICLMDGKIKVGVNEEELSILAETDNVRKTNARDIAGILESGEIGATTVSASIICSYLAGIEVFATGGIGGVHRNADSTFDISSDLQIMAQYPIIVVSAGAKSILDIPKTLEYLETCSIPVYGYQTDSFPLFHTAVSPYLISRIESSSQIVKLYQIHKKIQKSAILIANPIPGQDEICYDSMQSYIEAALRDAESNKVSGKKLTPFLLNRLAELSDGATVKANIALIKHNVKLACEIAHKFV
jgi:pseudouridine-5'-phosphate glycosidase